jgi:hypothetical protein
MKVKVFNAVSFLQKEQIYTGHAAVAAPINKLTQQIVPDGGNIYTNK